MPISLSGGFRFLASLLLHAGWAGLLLFLVLTAHIVLSGQVSSSAMAMDYALVLYLLTAAPVALLTPLALRLPQGQTLARLGGSLLLFVALWWVFWLPANLVDIAYTQRYHIPDPYVWPATAASQVIVVASAAWLLGAHRLNSWRASLARLLAYLIATTEFALISTLLADWASLDDALWLLIPVIAFALAPCVLKRPAPVHPQIWRDIRFFVCSQALLAVLWILVYRVGDCLPESLNALGAAIIYR